MTLIKNINIDFSKKDILSYLGYKPKKAVEPLNLEWLLEDALHRARLVLTPMAIYKTLDVDKVEHEAVSFVGTSFCISGKEIARFMGSCSKVTLAAATVGEAIEREISSLFASGASGNAVVLDAVGSDAVEQVISWVNRLIDTEAENNGFDTLHRVSPGYSLWSIEANMAIAEELEADKIGIRVLPSFEMLPRKSVMAAIGWVPKEISGRRG
jgi:hypothetical protein